MLLKQVIFAGNQCTIACDGKCEKAWGINTREKAQLSDDEDDYEYLADYELRTAPKDPGTYEGGHGKPQRDEDRLNKWCARECERCITVDRDEAGLIVLLDFSQRVSNKK